MKALLREELSPSRNFSIGGAFHIVTCTHLPSWESYTLPVASQLGSWVVRQNLLPLRRLDRLPGVPPTGVTAAHERLVEQVCKKGVTLFPSYPMLLHHRATETSTRQSALDVGSCKSSDRKISACKVRIFRQAKRAAGSSFSASVFCNDGP